MALNTASRVKVDEMKTAVNAGGSIYLDPRDQRWTSGHRFTDLDGYQLIFLFG